jgi:hypothetical protein
LNFKHSKRCVSCTKIYLRDSVRVLFEVLPIYLPQTVCNVRASSVSHDANGNCHLVPPVVGLNNFISSCVSRHQRNVSPVTNKSGIGGQHVFAAEMVLGKGTAAFISGVTAYKNRTSLFHVLVERVEVNLTPVNEGSHLSNARQGVLDNGRHVKGNFPTKRIAGHG